MSREHADSGRRSVVRARRLGTMFVAVAAAVSSAVVFAAAGGATSSTAPANSTPPAISGTAQEGATLTVDNGTWSGDTPISYAYGWLRCAASGGSCSAIVGQTSSSYVLKNVDVGTTLRAAVTAMNTDGSTTATTIPTAVVTSAPSAPANTSPPTISGVAQDGRALVASPGGWSGTAPITYSYRWERCDKTGAKCSFVTGSSALQAHLLSSADVGTTARVEVTATNATGSKTATSAQTAVVAAVTTPTGCAKNGGTIPVADVTPPARLVVDQTQVSPPTVRFGTTIVVARFHVSACGGPVQGALVYATAVPYNQFSIPKEQVTDAGGWATLQFGRLGSFPTTHKQRLLVMFVRARKAGDNLLGGISSRRLISFRVTP